MERDSASLQLDAWLARARRFERSPDLVRARLLARARCAAAASNLSPAPPVSVVRGPRRRQAALAGAVILASAAAAARGSLHVLASRAERDAPVVEARDAVRAGTGPDLPVTTFRSETSHLAVPAFHGRGKDTYRLEVDLLKPALSAYARRDFLDVLVLIAEHRRRFPNGQLAEEAELLRVRSLAGLGRAKEARAAAEAFGARFPHSVALPRLRQALDPS